MKRQRLTPALPIEVVTPNVFIDSSPMVATTKGVKMGPGHCGRATKGKSGKPGWHSVITRPGKTGIPTTQLTRIPLSLTSWFDKARVNPTIAPLVEV
jgi:hypothetical protein